VLLGFQPVMSLANETVGRFIGRVQDYVRYRPGYPSAVADVICVDGHIATETVVADIGCGPGTSAEMFLCRGYQVIGVEPNPEMRQAAETRFASDLKFRCVAGTAEATTLPDDSVNIVVAGQAFHWFDVLTTRREFARILRPPGTVALFWNTMRTNTPLLRDYERLLQRYGTDYQQVHHKNLSDDVFRAMFPNGWRRFVFDNVQTFDLAGVQGRLRSSSFVPPEGHPNFEPMMAVLNQLFDQYQVDGQVRFEYDTELYLGLVELS
jgi:SAM-dependent methyltransferase